MDAVCVGDIIASKDSLLKILSLKTKTVPETIWVTRHIPKRDPKFQNLVTDTGVGRYIKFCFTELIKVLFKIMNFL